MALVILDALKARFVAGEILEIGSEHGDEWVRADPASWREVATFLRDDPKVRCDMFVDLTCVDRSPAKPRFDVVVHLRSTEKKHRIRIYGGLPEEKAEIDSLVTLWPGVNWFEREAFDMFGVRFLGHPDLRRILMYPEFVGYPLRKDYPKEKRQPLVRRLPGSV